MTPKEQGPITYRSTGVDYAAMDPLKRMAQLKARETAGNLETVGYRDVEASRGESAYVWEEPDKYGALVIEGLGTKNIVAEEMRKITGKTYHDAIAQDDVAMIVNDIIVVGARPLVVNAYFAAGNSQWFSDEEKMQDLTDGFRDACNKAGAVWGGGESPTLRGIITEGTADLAGSCVGEIKPKDRLTLGDKLTAGDRILLVESSGVHANGFTLCREIAFNHPQGYKAHLPDGSLYGESLLIPTHIYVNLIQDLFEQDIDIHYMVNVTGHGWKKLMRANRDFTYAIDKIPDPQPVFQFIQEQSGNDDREMYGNFNMGAGFAIFVPQTHVDNVQKIGRQHSFNILDAGVVEEGPKQVIIKPKNNLVFNELGVR